MVEWMLLLMIDEEGSNHVKKEDPSQEK